MGVDYSDSRTILVVMFIKEPPSYLPDEALWSDELFECLPAAYPSENSGVCWAMPLVPRRADTRGVRCGGQTIVTVGEEVRAA